MEYFKSGLKSVLGAPTPDNLPSGADTVVKLVDRLLSSTLLDDRRDACRALKALSRTYRIEVGTQGIEALKEIWNKDKTDCEIIGLTLDTFCNITSPESFDEEVDKHGPKHNIGEQFTEILIKDQNIISKLLKLLDEFDFRVRWSTLKLLANLMSNKLKDIQEIILLSPMGVSKLMDMLSDSREVIRNDALLLLIQLTKGNTNIQKIVAFENAFDRIFDVISQEGGVEGGIVVEDCLLLMLNLLRGNNSNQNFFKEGSYIQKLTPMFHLDTTEDHFLTVWNPQKISNIFFMVQVIRALVVPNGPVQLVAACQNTMKKCGLLQELCNILMISGVPADILTETINAVADVVRGNSSNQDFLANVVAPSSPPRPIVVVLLMSMINEKQPFLLRCAVLYCLQCFLHKNETKQRQLVQTLLPQGKDNSCLTTGQLLCGGLLSSDSLSNWFSAVALSYALTDSTNPKEQLLRVLLATNIGTPPVTLMQQCVLLFQQSNKIQSQLGFLMFLCKWTSYCPLVVKSFLSIEFSIPFLIGLLSAHENCDDLPEMLLQCMCAFLIGICIHFNDNSVSNYTKIQLCNLVENRIGLEKFQNSIGGLSKQELYTRSLKHPQPSAKNSSELLLDHEFCRLFKTLEGIVLKSIVCNSSSNSNNEHINYNNSPDSALISQYQDLIREQDLQIQQLRQSVNNLTKENQELKFQLNELKSEVNSLLDQTKVLRAAQISFSKEPFDMSPSSNSKHVNEKLSLENYKDQIKKLENRLSESLLLIKELENKSSENKLVTNVQEKLEQKIKEYDKLKDDQENLFYLIAHQDCKLTKCRNRLRELGKLEVDLEESSGELDVEDQ